MTENDEGQILATAIPICWAYSKQKQRCEMAAGHLGDHCVTYAWDDTKCFDPDVDALVEFIDKPVPFIPSARASGRTVSSGVLRTFDDETGVFTDTPIEEDDNLLGETGLCFSCGVAEDDHEDNPYGCVSYVP